MDFSCRLRRRLSPHPNIIKLLEVLYDQPTGRLALVFELMDMNIYELIRGRRHYVAEDRVKRYMYQLMKAMDHMHRNGIFHRDIKPENILIMDESLKLADFGSCRGIHSKQPFTEVPIPLPPHSPPFLPYKADVAAPSPLSAPYSLGSGLAQRQHYA